MCIIIVADDVCEYSRRAAKRADEARMHQELQRNPNAQVTPTVLIKRDNTKSALARSVKYHLDKAKKAAAAAEEAEQKKKQEEEKKAAADAVISAAAAATASEHCCADVKQEEAGDNGTTLSVFYIHTHIVVAVMHACLSFCR